CLDVAPGDSQPEQGVAADEQGDEKARVCVCRADDLLRVHAGGGHGQRPRGALLPVYAIGAYAAKTFRRLCLRASTPTRLDKPEAARRRLDGSGTAVFTRLS